MSHESFSTPFAVHFASALALAVLFLGAGCVGSNPPPPANPWANHVDAIFLVNPLFLAQEGEIECADSLARPANSAPADGGSERDATLVVRLEDESAIAGASVTCKSSYVRPCFDDESACSALGFTTMRVPADTWTMQVTRPAGHPPCEPGSTGACQNLFRLDADGIRGGSAEQPTPKYEAFGIQNNFGTVYLEILRVEHGASTTNIWGGREIFRGAGNMRLTAGAPGHSYDYEARWWFDKTDAGHEEPSGHDRLSGVTYPSRSGIHVTVASSGRLDIYEA